VHSWRSSFVFYVAGLDARKRSVFSVGHPYMNVKAQEEDLLERPDGAHMPGRDDRGPAAWIVGSEDLLTETSHEEYP